MGFKFEVVEPFPKEEDGTVRPMWRDIYNMGRHITGPVFGLYRLHPGEETFDTSRNYLYLVNLHTGERCKITWDNKED